MEKIQIDLEICLLENLMKYIQEVLFHFKVNNEKEAKSLLSYLKCKLPHFMLILRKISQDISKNTIKWIPLPPLDRLWTNEEVYKYFGLKPNEIKIIEEKN